MKLYWLLLSAMICVFTPGCGGEAVTEEENAEIENTDDLTDDETAMEEDATNEDEE